MLKRLVIRTKVETRRPMKKCWKEKIFKSVKEGHPESHCIEGNKTDGKKNNIKESMKTSPDLVYPVDLASLKSEG